MMITVDFPEVVSWELLRFVWGCLCIRLYLRTELKFYGCVVSLEAVMKLIFHNWKVHEARMTIIQTARSKYFHPHDWLLPRKFSIFNPALPPAILRRVGRLHTILDQLNAKHNRTTIPSVKPHSILGRLRRRQKRPSQNTFLSLQ